MDMSTEPDISGVDRATLRAMDLPEDVLRPEDLGASPGWSGIGLSQRNAQKILYDAVRGSTPASAKKRKARSPVGDRRASPLTVETQSLCPSTPRAKAATPTPLHRTPSGARTTIPKHAKRDNLSDLVKMQGRRSPTRDQRAKLPVMTPSKRRGGQLKNLPRTPHKDSGGQSPSGGGLEVNDFPSFLKKGLMAVAGEPEMLAFETKDEYQTVDSTIGDMRTVCNRINKLVVAVEQEVRPHDGPLLALEEGGLDGVPTDAAERRVIELDRAVKLLEIDLKIQREAVARMEQVIEQRDQEVALLKGTVEELEEELAFLGDGHSGAGGGGGPSVGWQMGDSGLPLNTTDIFGATTMGNSDPLARSRRQSLGSPLILSHKKSAFGFSRLGASVISPLPRQESRISSGMQRQESSRITQISPILPGFSGAFSGSGMLTPLVAAEGMPIAPEEFDSFDLRTKIHVDAARADGRTGPRQKQVTAAPEKEVTFLSINIDGIDRLVPKYPHTFGRAASTYLAATERVVKRYYGYVVTGDTDQFMVAFHDPIAAAGCALELQQELVSLNWPEELEDDLDTQTVKIEADYNADYTGMLGVAATSVLGAAVKKGSLRSTDGSGTDDDVLSSRSALSDDEAPFSSAGPRASYLWRGLRARMGIHRCTSAQQQRDLCSGEMRYYGTGPKMAMFVESQSQGGLILVDDSVVADLEESLVELHDPIISFHAWMLFPGSRGAASRLWRVTSIPLAGRVTDFDANFRRVFPPKLVRLIAGQSKRPPTEQETNALLEESSRKAQNRQRYLAEIAESGAGEEYVNTPQQQSLQGEGTFVAQPLDGGNDAEDADEELLSSSTIATTLSIVAREWVQAPPPFHEKGVNGMPSGDQCVVVVSLVDYDRMLSETGIDENALHNYLKRFQMLIKQLKPLNSNATLIKSHNDKTLLVFSEPLPALQFALALQERSATMAWPDSPVEISPYLRNRYYKKTLVHSGPRINIVLHWCRLKAVKNIFSKDNNFYTGSDVERILAMVRVGQDTEVAGTGGCILLSEVMYANAIFNAAFSKGILATPAGTLPKVKDDQDDDDDHQGEPGTAGRKSLDDAAMAAVAKTRRSIPVRMYNVPQSLYKVTSRTLYGRFFTSVADLVLDDETSGGWYPNLEGKKTIFPKHVPIKPPSQYIYSVWESLIEQSVTRLQGEPMPPFPSMQVMGQCETISSLATQSVVTRAHFEKLKENKALNTLFVLSHEGYRASPSGRRRRTIEQLEMAKMFEVDAFYTNAHPCPEVVVNKYDLTDWVTAIQDQTQAAVTSAQSEGNPLGGSLNEGGTSTPQSTPRQAGLGAGGNVDAERAYFQQREQKVQEEVMRAHNAVHFYFTALKQYLNPLVDPDDENASPLGDDEFIVALIQHIRAAEAESKQQGGDKADGSGGNVKIGDHWRHVMSEAVSTEGSQIGYDVVKLCHSLVAHCCKHFLFARTMLRRVQRREHKLKGSIAKNPSGSAAQFEKVAKEALRVARGSKQEGA